MIRDVVDLEVYQESLLVLKDLCDYLKKIPRSEKDTDNQIRRAAKSVPANMAEGFAKRSSEAEFKRYLKIALGSSDEVITHLRIVYVLVPYLRKETEQLAKRYKVISKRINKLHSVWRTGYF